MLSIRTRTFRREIFKKLIYFFSQSRLPREALWCKNNKNRSGRKSHSLNDGKPCCLPVTGLLLYVVLYEAEHQVVFRSSFSLLKMYNSIYNDKFIIHARKILEYLKLRAGTFFASVFLSNLYSSECLFFIQ
jgi:hypothetical protein